MKLALIWIRRNLKKELWMDSQQNLPQSPIILIAAINSSLGLAHSWINNSVGDQQGATTEDFQNFLLDLIPKVPQSSVLILGNCKIYHAENLSSTWQMIK